MDDNLYRLWHHIWPMSVFDHRPKALSFPIRVYLCGFNARGQHVYKLCIFFLWILYFVESASKNSQGISAVLFHQVMLFEKYSRFKYFYTNN